VSAETLVFPSFPGSEIPDWMKRFLAAGGGGLGFGGVWTAVIVAQVAADEQSPFAAAARSVLVALLDALGEAMDFGAGLDQAAVKRAADPALTAREVGLLGAAVRLIREPRAG